MHFRTGYLTTRLPLDLEQSASPLLFVHPRRNPIAVELRGIEKDDPHYAPDVMYCYTTMERDVSNSRLEAFRLLSEKTEASRAKPDILQFCDSINDMLTEYARNTITTLRWRLSLSGSHNPFQSFLWLYGSLDGSTWFRLPTTTTVSVSDMLVPKVTQQLSEEIVGMVSNRILESVYHEIYRETALHSSSDRRAALVLGIAAAEIGCKKLVSNLVPNSTWLMSEIPSPPLISLLRDYLPIIEPRFSISPELIRVLEAGVQKRNQIVHGKSTSVDHKQVSSVLSAVKGLLFWFDFYSGYEWSEQYARGSENLE